MKLIAKVLLFIFIAFLTTPTIVTVIKKTTNSSLFFSFSEEEKAHQDIKVAVYSPIFEHDFIVLNPKKSKLIVSENIVKLDNISPSIFAPPPNLS